MTLQSTADLMDRDDQVVSCLTQFTDFGGVSAFHGTIHTVKCFEDTVLVKQVLDGKVDQGVLVIDGGGSLRTALLGDRTAAIAQANGWVGVVAYGVVRDVGPLAGLRLGVKAIGTNPRRSDQNGAGVIDVPVSFGGIWFYPGAELWADADGVVTRYPASDR